MYKELKEKPFGHGFADVIDQYDWDATVAAIDATTPDDVRHALARAASGARQLDVEDFMALISPAADPFLEQMAATVTLWNVSAEPCRYTYRCT